MNTIDISFNFNPLNKNARTQDGIIDISTSNVTDNSYVDISLNGIGFTRDYSAQIVDNSATIIIPKADIIGIIEPSANIFAYIRGRPDISATEIIDVDYTCDITNIALSWGSKLVRRGTNGYVKVTTNGIPDNSNVDISLNGKTYSVDVSNNLSVFTIPAVDLQSLPRGQMIRLDVSGSDQHQNDTSANKIFYNVDNFIKKSWYSTSNDSKYNLLNKISQRTRQIKNGEVVSNAVINQKEIKKLASGPKDAGSYLLNKKKALLHRR